jgi:hypothetical protein
MLKTKQEKALSILSALTDAMHSVKPKPRLFTYIIIIIVIFYVLNFFHFFIFSYSASDFLAFECKKIVYCEYVRRNNTWIPTLACVSLSLRIFSASHKQTHMNEGEIFSVFMCSCFWELFLVLLYIYALTTLGTLLRNKCIQYYFFSLYLYFLGFSHSAYLKRYSRK